MSRPQRYPVRGSPAAGISDKYFITPHRAGPRKVPAASDPAEHPFLPGQKDVAGWGLQAGSGAQKASSFPPWCHVRSGQLSSAQQMPPRASLTPCPPLCWAPPCPGELRGSSAPPPEHQHSAPWPGQTAHAAGRVPLPPPPGSIPGCLLPTVWPWAGPSPSLSHF